MEIYDILITELNQRLKKNNQSIISYEQLCSRTISILNL